MSLEAFIIQQVIALTYDKPTFGLQKYKIFLKLQTDITDF